MFISFLPGGKSILYKAHLLTNTWVGAGSPLSAQSSPADVNLTHMQQLLIVGPVLVPIASTGVNTLFDLDIFIKKSE